MGSADRKAWRSLWRWPLALGVLGWLVVSNLGGVRELVSAGVLWPWIITCGLLRMAAMGLASMRWKLLLSGQEIHLPLGRVFRLFATGYVCNFLLPGTVGGDVARAGMIAADSPQRRMRGAATVPLDRLLGLLAFILVGAIAGFLQWRQIPEGLLRTAVVLLAAIGAGGLCSLLALLVIRFPAGKGSQSAAAADVPPAMPADDAPAVRELSRRDRRRALGHELLFGLALLRQSRGSVLVALALAVVGHSLLSLSMYCCLRAYPAADVPLDALAHLWIVPSAEVPAALLPMPGGVGAREGTLALLYAALSQQPSLSAKYREIGVVVAATFSTVSIVLAILIGGTLALSGGWPSRRNR